MRRQLHTGVLALALGVAATGTGLAAEPAPAAPWPVAVARDGFSPAQADQVHRGFAPLKLAAAGDQALYSYLNMAQFFPHQSVARGGNVKVLPVHLDRRLGALRVATALGKLSLDELLADPRSRVQGLLVLHNGRVVLERYPGMRPTDSHLWWSVAKVIAGALTGMLIDEGKVDASKAIVSYLPEFADSGWAGASVEDVLNMASGIAAPDSAEGYVNPQSEIGRLIYAEGILAQPGLVPVGHDRALAMMSSAGKPGAAYQYSSANTNMLGLLIERVTGKRYADVVSERVWSRIGAEGDGLLGLTPDGRAIAHGMYSSRLRDLARFGLLFTPGGRIAEVLPQRILDRIGDRQHNRPYANASAAAASTEQLGERPVNALAQWDALFADGDLFKSGYDGQALYVSPARDVVIALYSTSKDQSAYAYLRAIAAQFPGRARDGG